MDPIQLAYCRVALRFMQMATEQIQVRDVMKRFREEGEQDDDTDDDDEDDINNNKTPEEMAQQERDASRLLQRFRRNCQKAWDAGCGAEGDK